MKKHSKKSPQTNSNKKHGQQKTQRRSSRCKPTPTKECSEKENSNEETYRKSVRTTHKGPLDHMFDRQTSNSQSRKRTSNSPAGDRKTKDPKLSLNPKYKNNGK